MHERTERPERRLVCDHVLDHRPAVLPAEAVLVVPATVRPDHLEVTEAMGWVVLADQRAPADGQAHDAHTVVDRQAARHHDGLRDQDAETEPWRRDQWKVLRPLEEFERLA